MFSFIMGLTIGFVIGILFGRRNTKKVEAALAELEKRYEDLIKELKEGNQ